VIILGEWLRGISGVAVGWLMGGWLLLIGGVR